MVGQSLHSGSATSGGFLGMIAVDAVRLLDWNQMVSLDFLGIVSDQVVGQSLHSLSRRSRFNKRQQAEAF